VKPEGFKKEDKNKKMCSFATVRSPAKRGKGAGEECNDETEDLIQRDYPLVFSLTKD
jgi:hypothetical protein